MCYGELPWCMPHHTKQLLSQHGFITHVGLCWLGQVMGRQRIERSMNFLVLAISREYQTLFPDRDVESLWFMRERHNGDVSAAVKSLQKRLL